MGGLALRRRVTWSFKSREWGLTRRTCLAPFLTLTVGISVSSEFQRGQYPDSVARGKLAAATSLPEDTVRVSELCITA